MSWSPFVSSVLSFLCSSWFCIVLQRLFLDVACHHLTNLNVTAIAIFIQFSIFWPKKLPLNGDLWHLLITVWFLIVLVSTDGSHDLLLRWWPSQSAFLPMKSRKIRLLSLFVSLKSWPFFLKTISCHVSILRPDLLSYFEHLFMIPWTSCLWILV